MPQKFHERFNIEVGIEEAKRRFVSRAYNLVFTGFVYKFPENQRYKVTRAVLSALGIKINIHRRYQDLSDYIGTDFIANLQALEALYTILPDKRELDTLIKHLFVEAEVDLGVRWENGEFRHSGAPLLDEKLVNDVLGWLKSKKYEGVLTPFHKGLDSFLHSTAKPELLTDVVRDMYEALEALAKVETDNDRDLSANQEQFLSKVKVSKEYKPILKAYVDYANELFRHAAEKGQKKPVPSRKEVESFVYMTGLFLRLAME